MGDVKKLPNNKENNQVVVHDGPRNFNFPYQPYSLQTQLMTDMYHIFAQRQVGILESPTGTGKTLSSLCAVLTFIRDEHQTKRNNIDKKRKRVEELRKTDDNETFEESLEKLKEKDRCQKEADEMDDKMKRVEQRVEAAKRRMKDYKKVDGKDLSDMEDGFENNEKEPPELLKVVYATRTHSQIDQLTKELDRTSFKPRVVALGSRAKLCPNNSVNTLPNAVAAEKCKDLREKRKCPYYGTTKVRRMADNILSGSTRNADAVMKESNCSQACGYYGSREAAPYCELIFVPYATLFEAEMRNQVGLTIDSDTIVIVDEAHNLYATLTEMSSALVTLSELQTGASILDAFLQAEGDRVTSAERKNLKQFSICCSKTAMNLGSLVFVNEKKRNFKSYSFLQKVFEGSQMQYITAVESAKKGTLLSRIRSFTKRQQAAEMRELAAADKKHLSGVQKLLQNRKRKHESVVADPGPSTPPPETPEEVAKFPLFKLAEFFSALGSALDNFEVVVNIEDAEAVVKTERSIHLLCLNGGEKFKSIVTKAKSTILIGGTMQPSDMVMNLLTKDCGIEKENIVERSYGHIIDNKNLKIVTIKSDNHGPLTLNHAALKNKQTHHRILASMTPFINDTPNGMAVFFPSRSFLESFLKEVSQSKPPGFTELTRRGYITETMYPDAFDRYVKQANNRRATFFAVIGGKFSEGVNFNDSVARCVVIVGLPYPNTFSDEFKAKADFLKKHFNDESIAAKLPLNICMTAVNQTIGRVVRHKEDYGVVVLMDARYGKARHTNALSGWMHKCLSNTENKVDARRTVEGFKGMYLTSNAMKS
uniref:Helicase ATP-binding domain-containing protein n=1 Tax=Panagrellus redivivus TaxID=6233 RepID=A0A7E4V6S2_PANRE